MTPVRYDGAMDKDLTDEQLGDLAIQALVAGRIDEIRAEVKALLTAQIPIINEDGEWMEVVAFVPRADVLVLLGEPERSLDAIDG